MADEYFPVLNVRLYMCILLLPLILINWVRNLKYLAPFSSIANAVTLVSFGIIAYYLFSDIKSLEDRAAVANFKGMPLFFGTVLFAMEAIGVVCFIVYIHVFMFNHFFFFNLRNICSTTKYSFCVCVGLNKYFFIEFKHHFIFELNIEYRI